MKHVDEVLANFLEDEEAGILAIKGEWGVGKTYFWRKFIEKHLEDVNRKAYSYCSLFGIHSIADLREMILNKHQPIGGGNAESFLSKYSSLTQSVLGTASKAATGLKTDALVGIIGGMAKEHYLKDFLICLDDIERKEDSLSASSLLGYITSLREEKNCKVVLLFNEEKISKTESFKSVFSEYREKVIDLEIGYNPTPKECFEIIFEQGESVYFEKGQYRNTDPVYGSEDVSILELFEKLKVTNIRVIGKVKVALDYFHKKVAPEYPYLFPNLAVQIVKMSCLHYIYGNQINIDELGDYQKMAEIYSKKDTSDEHRLAYEKQEPIRTLNFHRLDFDGVILEFLKLGYVKWDEHKVILDSQEEYYKNLNVNSGHRNVWSKYWGNFVANQKDFVESQIEYIRANIDTLPLKDIDIVSGFIEDLGEDTEEINSLLNEKIDSFVESNKDSDLFSLGLHDFHDIRKETVEDIKARFSQISEKRPILETMKKLAGSNSWNDSNLRYLKGYSADEFYQWLVEEQEIGIQSMLKRFLERFWGNEEASSIVKNLNDALYRISEREKIDELRIYRGVRLPPKDNNSVDDKE